MCACVCACVCVCVCVCVCECVCVRAFVYLILCVCVCVSLIVGFFLTKDGQFLASCILQLQMAGYEPTQPEESGDIVKHKGRERDCGRAYTGGVGVGCGVEKGDY